MGGRRPLSIAEVHHSRQSHERDPSDENTKISLVRWLYSSHQHHSATTEIKGVVCVVVLVVRNATTLWYNSPPPGGIVMQNGCSSASLG